MVITEQERADGPEGIEDFSGEDSVFCEENGRRLWKLQSGSRTRWRSCQSRSGNLNLEAGLHCLRELLDYVVVHELAHRKNESFSQILGYL